MHVTIVPSSQPGQLSQLFTSYVVNGRVAIDAGCLDGVGSVEDMGRIKHVFLTHSHLDHVATLGPFLDAVYDGSGDCVQIYGNAHTLDCLRKDIFNNRLYPDFLHISTFRPPYLVLHEVMPGVAVVADGLRVTPIEVDHVVPTLGFIIEDDHSAIVIPSDTAPTEAIWKEAARRKSLAAVFLECTFPNEMRWLAEIARHLTPDLYALEIVKLGRPMRFITVHVHPRHRAIVEAELLAKKLPGVEIGVPGKTYTF